MRNLFPGFYHPSAKEFEELWQNAFFAVDANVLLNLYRYPKHAYDDLFTALDKVKERLWVPYQVVMEYQRNRVPVIAEQAAKISDVSSVLADAKSALNKGFEHHQLRKRNSKIAVTDLFEKVSRIFSEFEQQLERDAKADVGAAGPDVTREALDKLLGGKIGAAPTSQDELDKIYKAGKERYAASCPPGFKDTDKDTFMHGGLRYEAQFGDLLLWEQLIAETARRKATHVVLVTDDEKEDWWRITRTGGQKLSEPHPQLIEEMVRRAGVRGFYIYSTDGFLKYAAEYLGTQLKEESIRQVQDVARDRRKYGLLSRLLNEEDAGAEESVWRWLLRSSAPHNLQRTGPATFTVFQNPGAKLRFEVAYLPGRSPWGLFHSVIEKAEGKKTIPILVAGNRDDAEAAAFAIDRYGTRSLGILGVTDERSGLADFEPMKFFYPAVVADPQMKRQVEALRYLQSRIETL